MRHTAVHGVLLWHDRLSKLNCGSAHVAILVFLSPFSASLWITIACAPFFLAAVLTVIAKLTPLGIYSIIRTRQIDHHTGPPPVEEHAIEAGTTFLPSVM